MVATLSIEKTLKPLKKRIPRPFLKWVGGKTNLLPVLMANMPEYSGAYHEPFIGGGALFFELEAPKSNISDANKELIDCYKTVRDRPDDLIEVLSSYEYEKDFYYEIRAHNPDELDPVKRAARTIYLNKAGFNGLYRVNSKGGFNVPFGRHTNPMICDRKNLLGCSKALRDVSIEHRPFETVLDRAAPGDFVYFDPPYIPLSRSSSFTAYEKNGFGMKNQEKLAKVFSALADKGVYVMLSNADVPWIDEAYAEFNIQRVSAPRFVNSKASKRGPVLEVLVTSYK